MERADNNVLQRLNVKLMATYLRSGSGKCCIEWFLFLWKRAVLSVIHAYNLYTQWKSIILHQKRCYAL
jgi:hypothetical protein